MIFNNVPGLLLISGDPTLFPTLSMEQAEGEALVELTEAGTVIVGLDAVAVSPYLYDLVLPEPDQIPATLEYVVDDTTSATALIRYRSHVPDQPVGELRHKWRPWEFSSFGFLRQMPAPLARTEHISSGDTTYEQYFWAHSTLELPFDLAMFGAVPDVRRRPGAASTAGRSRSSLPRRPRCLDDIVDGGLGATASATTSCSNIPDFVDSRGHWGLSRRRTTRARSGCTRTTRWSGPAPRAFGTFPVGPGPSEYRLELDVDA